MRAKTYKSEMKHNTARLCGNRSSTNVLTEMHIVRGVSRSKETTDFVNHGLLLWNQSRKTWLGRRKATPRTRLFRLSKLRTLRHSMAKMFWLCCGNMSDTRFLESTKLFPKPIPLSEMVDFLVDIWEEEGMFD